MFVHGKRRHRLEHRHFDGGTIAAAALAIPASASDLYVGSLNTSFASATLPGGSFQTLGACGSQVTALAAEGDELYLAGTHDLVYRYRRDTQQTEVWTGIGNDPLSGLAIRGHELYVATTTAKIMVIDRSRGVFMQQWDLPIAATTLLVDRGHLYAGTSFGLVMEIAPDGTATFLGSCGSLIRGIAASANESRSTLRAMPLSGVSESIRPQGGLLRRCCLPASGRVMLVLPSWQMLTTDCVMRRLSASSRHFCKQVRR